MTDPICGMNVDAEHAAGSYVYNNQTYYFCSQHCLAKFKEDPEKFLKSPAAGRRRAWSQACTRARDAWRRSPKHAYVFAGRAVGAEGCRLCLSDGCRGARVEARRVPQVRDGLGAGGARRSAGKDGIRLSYASGDRARRAGRLSDLWHGARAAHGNFRRRGQSRADRYDAALLGRRGIERFRSLFSPCPK